MHRIPVLAFTLAFGFTALVGAEDIHATPGLGPNPTAEETVQALNDLRYADPAFVWDYLPNSYRQDVNDLIRLASKTIGQEMWDALLDPLRKFKQLHDEKHEFLVNSKHWEVSAPANLEAKKQQMIEAFELFAALIGRLSEGTLGDAQAMQSFDGNDFFAKEFPAMRKDAVSVAELIEKFDTENRFKQMDFQLELVSVDGDRATIRFTKVTPPTESKMILVENRWVVEEIATTWDEKVASARGLIEKLGSEQGKQQLNQVIFATGAVSNMINPMLAAETQEQFDGMLQGILGMAGGMLRPGL